MKSRTIWIQQALIELGIVFTAGAVAGILGFFMGKENNLESALFFISVYGLIMGPALDPAIFRNPVALALSMGETRKGTCRGLELTRCIYMCGVMALFILTVSINPFPDVPVWAILVGYMGILLSISGISAIFSALTYQRGSNCVWLRLLDGVLSALHIFLLFLFVKYPLSSIAALAEGLVLMFLSFAIEKKVFLNWDFRV